MFDLPTAPATPERCPAGGPHHWVALGRGVLACRACQKSVQVDGPDPIWADTEPIGRIWRRERS